MIKMTRLKAEDIKKVEISYVVSTNDPDFEPVKAGLTVEIDDQMRLGKQQFLETLKQVAQAFLDLFDNEVYD